MRVHSQLGSVLEEIERGKTSNFMHAQMYMRGDDMAVLQRYMHEVTNYAGRRGNEIHGRILKYLARHFGYLQF